MKTLTQVLFWLANAAIIYTYFGYPLLLALISWLRPRLVHRANCEPTVTVIITAYNEERALKAKLENTLALNYDQSRLEIVVASDCSTDGTDEITRAFAQRGVKLHRQNERLGKTAAQNAAVEVALGEIILFSDATTLYQADVLQALIPNFADSTVGCVAGHLIYRDPTRSSTGRGASSYWSYETYLRRHESRVSSLVGAPGCLYAVRRAAYVPLYHEACSDFIIATKMVEQGLRAVYEPRAICEEQANRRSHDELRMRVRVITQTLSDLWRHRSILNPLRSGFFGVQLLSHKVMRYGIPIFLLVTFFSSAALSPDSNFFLVAFAAQICFFAAAVVGWALERRGMSAGIFALPQYFVLTNLAIVLALYRFLRGRRDAKWEPIRERVAVSPNWVAPEGSKR